MAGNKVELNYEFTQAVVHNDVKKAVKFIQKQKNIDKKDVAHYTFLMEAAVWDRPDILQALLHAGADPNLQNKSSHTALMLAAMRGHTESVKVLINAGAKLDIQDYNGHTALKWAKIHSYTETFNLLSAAHLKQNTQRTLSAVSRLKGSHPRLKRRK